ncbi:MAG: hypothetical protein F6J95_033095 [Leptolyngbya sp. SIO1E4]|nr:hypothetical protein [Leptolyngbya sp. SIO1E4]
MATQAQRSLDLNDSYPCPVCRHGTIQALVLTDAFACDFCRHILSADLKQQQVQVIDGPQAITWVWEGQRWRVAHGTRREEVSSLIVFSALVLIIVPASLVWLAGFIFPPLSPTSPITFPTLWAFLTFLAHLSLVLWLVGEYYQIPFYVATKVRLFRRRSSPSS